VTGWQSRTGIGAGGVEHVAELGEPATAAEAAGPAPRLAWTDSDGWALYTSGGADPVATTGPDIQGEDPVAAQAWAAEQLALDGVDVVRWTDCPDGQPGYTAVVAS
jgi:hypothetical protein